MKIGFFGDSYIDLFNTSIDTPREYKPWSRRLVDDNKFEAINSGVSGTNQYHAITQWKNCIADNTIDIAFFTFTWHNRLYHDSPLNQKILSAMAENRDFDQFVLNLSSSKNDNLQHFYNQKHATQIYYDYIYSDNEAKFNFMLQIEYILNLPTLYPNIKFIFIPNTEMAREIAIDKFSKGCLIDFAFETLSNLEPESPGPMPVNCQRTGHINNTNHELLTKEFSNIVLNFDDYRDKIYKFDYNKFDIKL